jgi:nondiscriminating glutamyl-tRNA synthetase
MIEPKLNQIIRPVRVRFAPSPTGGLHPGNARVAIFNWLFAKHYDGKYVIRVEDTDEERSTLEFEHSIMNDLDWLGITWDEGPFRQSDRVSKYKEEAEKLLEKGYLYRCFCSDEELEEERRLQLKQGKAPRYSGKCKLHKHKTENQENTNFALRFDVQKFISEFNKGNDEVSFLDILKSKDGSSLKIAPSTIGDFVVMKKTKFPTYNFAVVVDDLDMDISHVFRGEDHVSNTFRQLMLFYAMGIDENKIPSFGHLPMLLAPDKTKLSKRSGGVPIHEYKAMGFLPEAMFAHLAFLGGSMKGLEETNTKEVLIKGFDYLHTSTSPSVYDLDQLKSINSKFIEKKTPEELTKILESSDNIVYSQRTFADYQKVLKEYYEEKDQVKIVALLKEGVKTLSDVIAELDLFIPSLEQNPKIQELSLEQKEAFNYIYSNYFETNKKISGSEWLSFKEDVSLSSGLKGGKLFKTLRLILTGKEQGPSLDQIMKIINNEVVFSRIEKIKTILG